MLVGGWLGCLYPPPPLTSPSEGLIILVSFLVNISLPFKKNIYKKDAIIKMASFLLVLS